MKDYLKKNKGLIILPLVLLPFVVLLFYVLGGGDKAGEENNKASQEPKSGVNTYLPQAEKSIEIVDKMEAYQQQNALGDKQVLVRDTMYHHLEVEYPLDSTGRGMLLEQLKHQPKTTTSNQLLAHIKAKEDELKGESAGDGSSQTNAAEQPIVRKAPRTILAANTKPSNVFKELAEVEQLFDEHTQMSQENDSLRFYMKQMETKLKAIDEKQKQRYQVDSKQGKRVVVKEDARPMIRAEVYETTKLLPGQRTKLRLLEDVWVNGLRIPAYSFVYGTVQVKNERLKVTVTSLPMKDMFLPVELAVLDLDGLEGLYVPGNAARKVSKDIGGSASTSSIWGMNQDPLTNLSIQTADRTSQALLKRTRLKKVTVKKNTMVYLVNVE